MKLHLISFKTCPFVQRAVITLKHKQIDYDITYIDLAEPPDWFLELSPLGKVPVLKVDDEVLFESAVINEYLDEISGGDLQPGEPLARAKNRAWIEFASNMLGNLYMMKMSQDESSYHKYRDRLTSQLYRVENRLWRRPLVQWRGIFPGRYLFRAPVQTKLGRAKPPVDHRSGRPCRRSMPGPSVCWPYLKFATQWSMTSKTCIWR